jgi:hypothetical protein
VEADVGEADVERADVDDIDVAEGGEVGDEAVDA